MEDLYVTYAEYIKRCVAKRRLGSYREDAEQEVWRKLWANQKTLSALETKQISSYLWKTVRSVAANHWRKEERLKTVSMEELQEDNGFSLPDRSAPAPSTRIEQQERMQALSRLLNSLPPRERALLTLSARGLADEEIASCLGLQLSSVRVYRMRARKRLLRQMQLKADC